MAWRVVTVWTVSSNREFCWNTNSVERPNWDTDRPLNAPDFKILTFALCDSVFECYGVMYCRTKGRWMKAIKKIISIFLVLFLSWFVLKSAGLIGRQFSDGLNTSENFSINSGDENFKMTINPYKRGIYRYNAYLVFDGEAYTSDKFTQNIEVNFTEKLCETSREIGSAKLIIRSIPGRSTSQGLGRYGKITKTKLLERSNPICLHIKISSLSEPISPNLELSVYVVNTRPCWGIECMLD